MSDARCARLLLAILQDRWDEAEELARANRAAGSEFSSLCARCEVATWVHARLSATGRFDLISDAAKHELEGIRRRIQRDNLILVAYARQALDALAQAGVTPIVLKGLDLIHRVYAFDERTIGDVDILVSSTQLPRAYEALVSNGWRPPPVRLRRQYIRSSHHLRLSNTGAVLVPLELHWNLAQTTRFDVRVDELFERARRLDVDGLRVLRLDDHDFVAHLLLHHFTHYFDRRLKWAVDIGRLSRHAEFDWDRVAATVRGWRAALAAGAAASHLRRCFPDFVPDTLVRDLAVPGWRNALVLPLRSGHPLDAYRWTRQRWVQLYLAAAFFERPLGLLPWLRHRIVRKHRSAPNPLEGLDC